MINLTEILAYNFGANSIKEYLIALGIFVLAICALKIFKTVGIKRIKKVAGHTRIELDDMLIKIIDSIGWPFYVFLSLYLSFQFIRLPEIIEKIVFYIVLILVAYYIVKSVQSLIEYGVDKIVQQKQKEDEKLDPSAFQLLGKVLKGLLWVVAILIVLQNLGYNISLLITGLGIGGVAVAFALQSILGDIFASFSIYFDKPFQVGDFIIVKDDSGVVEKIGIKSTRIRTLQGEELVISNKELTETRVHNYRRMEKRRVAFSFGVVYETPIEKLKKIPDIVKDIVNKIELADMERAHFKKLGDFSLDFEVVYYLSSSDYNEYMDTQQVINLALKKEFEKEGIEFAYPTQTIFINNPNSLSDKL